MAEINMAAARAYGVTEYAKENIRA